MINWIHSFLIVGGHHNGRLSLPAVTIFKITNLESEMLALSLIGHVNLDKSLNLSDSQFSNF